MAGDVVSLMRHLGDEQFAVVGHDRGSLVAFRTAMDYPRVVARLVVMTVCRSWSISSASTRRSCLLGGTGGSSGRPRSRRNGSSTADPDAWYRTPPPAEMGEGNHADVWAALPDPAVVHGMCEDYPAGLNIDRAHEEADRAAGRRRACPTLLLGATEDDIDIHGDPGEIWRPWVAGELRSGVIHSGHHQAERAPDELAQALIDFLAAPTQR